MARSDLWTSDSGPTGDLDSSNGELPCWTSDSKLLQSFLSNPASLPIEPWNCQEKQIPQLTRHEDSQAEDPRSLAFWLWMAADCIFSVQVKTVYGEYAIFRVSNSTSVIDAEGQMCQLKPHCWPQNGKLTTYSCLHCRGSVMLPTSLVYCMTTFITDRSQNSVNSNLFDFKADQNVSEGPYKSRLQYRHAPDTLQRPHCPGKCLICIVKHAVKQLIIKLRLCHIKYQSSSLTFSAWCAHYCGTLVAFYSSRSEIGNQTELFYQKFQPDTCDVSIGFFHWTELAFLTGSLACPTLKLSCSMTDSESSF